MQRSVSSDGLEGLQAPELGLTGQVAAERRARYGANAIVEAPPHGWTDVVRDSLRDPMLWFLLGTSVLFAFVGDRTEAAILLAALVPLFGMDAWLHRRTQASVAGLSSRLAATARVLRDGAWTDIPAVELGPGDVLSKMHRWTLRRSKSDALEEPVGIARFASDLGAVAEAPAPVASREENA